jgi:hypothetical protein
MWPLSWLPNALLVLVGGCDGLPLKVSPAAAACGLTTAERSISIHIYLNKRDLNIITTNWF